MRIPNEAGPGATTRRTYIHGRSSRVARWKWSCNDDRAGRPVTASGKSPNLTAAGLHSATRWGGSALGTPPSARSPPGSASARASSVRDRSPRFRSTAPTWCSTVFGLRNSADATSRFLRPWATSSATLVSCEVSGSRVAVARLNSLPGADLLLRGTLRPEREVHRGELSPCGRQLHPSVDASTFAAQPHAVEQPRAGCLEPVRRDPVRGDGPFERQRRRRRGPSPPGPHIGPPWQPHAGAAGPPARQRTEP